MKTTPALLAGAIALALAACDATTSNITATPSGDAAKAPAGAPTSADADAFVEKVNADRRARYPESASAQWVSVTYINPDTQMLAAKANERELGAVKAEIDASKQYAKLDLKPDTARAIKLLELSTSIPAPKDPAKLAELTQIGTRLEGAYGAAKYCKGEGEAQQCRDLGELEDVLKTSRDYAVQLDAWRGWHDTARGSRAD